MNKLATKYFLHTFCISRFHEFEKGSELNDSDNGIEIECLSASYEL